MPSTFDPDHPYGDRTRAVVDGLRARDVRRASLLVRHSAREYAPGRHDLENPLTEAGRELARGFGLALDPAWAIRGYASPVARCEDTAELIHAAHLEQGGRGRGGSRPVEALGVFYVLDQMRMFKALSAAGGLAPFVDAWLAGRVPRDVVMPAEDAVRILVDCLVARMGSQREAPGLDLCVSHDLTLHVVRAVLLDRPPSAGAVEYLDGIVLFEEDGGLFAATHDAEARRIADAAPAE